jgi:hypothetical protein
LVGPRRLWHRHWYFNCPRVSSPATSRTRTPCNHGPQTITHAGALAVDVLCDRFRRPGVPWSRNRASDRLERIGRARRDRNGPRTRPTGVAATATTNEAGSFTVPYLIPGSYTVGFELSGFHRVVRVGRVARRPIGWRSTRRSSRVLWPKRSWSLQVPLLDGGSGKVCTIVHTVNTPFIFTCISYRGHRRLPQASKSVESTISRASRTKGSSDDFRMILRFFGLG